MRKKKKQDNRLYCPYCGRQAVLRPAMYVYGERNLDPENYLYVCGGYPACDSYIGVHKKEPESYGNLGRWESSPQADRSTPGVKRSDKRRGYDQTWALYLAAEPALPFRNRNAYRKIFLFSM